jgi:hypothetical protein
MEFFSIVAIAAIASGGTIAAFRARRPTRFVMWLTAYLVLIEGLVQFGLATSWQQLNVSASWIVIAAFLMYNFGNIAVIVGRALKSRLSQARWVTYLGGALLIIATLLLVWAARHATLSWWLVWFAILVVIILVSTPIGLVFSSRRK